MGCCLSTQHICQVFVKESKKILSGESAEPISEMESSESGNQQGLEKTVTSTHRSLQESNRNHSLPDSIKDLSIDNHEVPLSDMDKNKSEQMAEIETNKLTSEEIAHRRKEVLEKLEETMLLMSTTPFRHLDREGAPFTKEFRQCVLKLAKSYFYFKIGEVPYSEIYEYRIAVGAALNRLGIIRVMCDVLSDGFRRLDFMDDSRKMINEYWFPIKNILLTLLNFSDLDEMIRISVTTQTDVLPLLVQVLGEWQNEHLNDELSEDQNKLIKWSLSILHNCASSDDNIPRLRELGIIQVVLPYLDSKNENIRLSSISVLALLVNEEEAQLLGTHVSIFQFMIRKLGKALKREDRKDLGWSAAELTTAIGKLARNDANKKVLVDEGCLPLLVELLRTGDERETGEALNCLWALSFDHDNKKKMVEEPGLVTVVYDKYLTLDASGKHNCQGVLWSLREELLAYDEYRSIGEEISNLKNISTVTTASPSPPGKVPGAPRFQGHIMISYQWANQDIIKQICQVLRCHGLPVWIDIDYMGGCTLQAMAKAVEDSFTVIMAMSQKYKDSPNTRAEAEYTFQQRKPIIPLIMQQGYRPDGWLGLILGTKFYYDFSGKYSFESRMDALLGAVKAVVKSDNLDGRDRVKPQRPPRTPGLTAQPHIKSKTTLVTSLTSDKHVTDIDKQSVMVWTQEDVSRWLTRYNMESSTLNNLCGEEIIFLYNLQFEAPEFFYHCLESKLHLTSLLDLGRAARALSDLGRAARAFSDLTL